MKTLLEALKEVRDMDHKEFVPLKIVIGRNTAREWIRHFGPFPEDQYIVHDPDIEGMQEALKEWQIKNPTSVG